MISVTPVLIVWVCVQQLYFLLNGFKKEKMLQSWKETAGMEHFFLFPRFYIQKN